ncbi:MAG: hypothetical protein Q7T29_02935 [Gallionella sp.]|nr:hypothetical protein [Gallionella sp.]
MTLSDRNFMRLCLAMTVSLFFHALLLGIQDPAIADRKVEPLISNSQQLNVVLAAKPRSRHEDARQRAASKHSKNLAVRKIQKPLAREQQKITTADKAEEPAPKSSMPDSAVKASTVKAEESPTQAIGLALQSMVSQQYMMMRLQQFFSISRQNAGGIIKSRFTQDKITHYQGKRCALRLLVAPVPGQGYEIAQPECDDPELAAELQAMTWSTAMPLPSEYSLPYQGLIVYLNIGSYDVSIGLEPIVAQSHNTVAPD